MTPPAAALPPRPRRAPRAGARGRPLPRRAAAPRLRSGAPPRAGARRPAAAAGARRGSSLGLLGALETLSGHRLLDRLIRGRMWIGIVAFALIGIVTLQLGLLKLNSGIGRSLEREARCSARTRR